MFDMIEISYIKFMMRKKIEFNSGNRMISSRYRNYDELYDKFDKAITLLNDYYNIGAITKETYLNVIKPYVRIQKEVLEDCNRSLARRTFNVPNQSYQSTPRGVNPVCNFFYTFKKSKLKKKDFNWMKEGF